MPLSRLTGNSFNATANTNIDNGLLFLNPTTNRLGIFNTTPQGTLDVGGISANHSAGDLLVSTDSTNARVTVGRLSSTSDDNTMFRVRNRVDQTAFFVHAGNRTANVALCFGVGGATPATSGSGITFPASQSASSDPNTLDDYEEGTWTGTIWAGSTEGTNTTSTWRYTKIGRLVYIVGETAYAQTWPTGGVFELRGLPFPLDGAWATGGCYMPGVGTTFRVVVPIIFSSYSTTIRFVDNSKGSGGSWVGGEISSSDFRPSTTAISMVYATST
jgi:hypothetical protein